VIRVGVGTPRQTQIPPLELPRYGAERLSGIRCLSTNLKSEQPSESALTAMALQRLDALVVFNITGGGFTKRGGGSTGYVKEAYLAHLVANSKQLVVTQSAGISIGDADTYSHISPPLSLDALADQDFLDLVASLEEEFSREYVAQEVDADHDRVVIVGVLTENITPQQFQDIIVELTRLVDTAGGIVLQTLQQKRSRIHPQTVIGEGGDRCANSRC
jgi:GTP-binding protein HflX